MKERRELPLVLISPLMHGPIVEAAQRALSHNPFDQDFLDGAGVDGEFGEWTARATHRAKFWLGFARPNGVYGEKLEGYLTGAAKLPLAKRLLRAKRQRDEKRMTLGDRIWAEAGKDLGLTEDPPGSNKNIITRIYGIVGPWCAMAGSVWMKRAGSKIPIVGSGYRGRYHYCPTALHDAQLGLNGLSLTRSPTRGTIVLFDWDNDGVPDHWEHFGEWVVRGKFRTRGGNTSFEGKTGSQSDGGAVAERIRYVSDVARTARGDLAWIHCGR